jgi:hypothetical protein
VRTGWALLLGLLVAAALASCGQLAPGSGQQGDCTTNNPHECCETVTPNHGYSCEQDNGPATCGPSGWTCPGLGFLAYACNGTCIPSPPLSGNPERDAETDATVGGDDTADDETDDETDGAPADDGGTGDAGACTGAALICCGLAPSGSYLCEFDYGAAICSPDGWACPKGGKPAPDCSTICTENPVATTDASPTDGAADSAPSSDATYGKE